MDPGDAASKQSRKGSWGVRLLSSSRLTLHTCELPNVLQALPLEEIGSLKHRFLLPPSLNDKVITCKNLSNETMFKMQKIVFLQGNYFAFTTHPVDFGKHFHSKWQCIGLC